MVFLPLLFLAVRRSVKYPKPNWPAVSLVIILCMLSQIPSTLAALVGAGIYVLIMAGKHYGRWLGFGGAVLLAFAALAIYILPAQYFLQFLDPARLLKSKNTWVNGTLHLEDLWLRTSAFAAFCVMSILCALLSLTAWRGRMGLDNDFSRREVLAWIIIGVVSIILVLPLCEPLWHMLDSLAGPVIAPWRIQALIMMAAVYLFCARAAWFLSEKKRKTFKGDTVSLLLFLMLIAGSLVTLRTDDREAQAQLRSIDWTVGVEYKPIWVDDEHITYEYLLKQADVGKPRAIAKIPGKQGGISNADITVDSIRFTAKLKKDADITIKHWYFPIWHATIDGKPADIRPQEHTGQMLVYVPKGTHDVILTRSISETIPELYRLSEWISFGACLLLLLWFIKPAHSRHFGF